MTGENMNVLSDLDSYAYKTRKGFPYFVLLKINNQNAGEIQYVYWIN